MLGMHQALALIPSTPKKKKFPKIKAINNSQTWKILKLREHGIQDAF
jgi:hypothetical protein